MGLVWHYICNGHKYELRGTFLVEILSAFFMTVKQGKFDHMARKTLVL